MVAKTSFLWASICLSSYPTTAYQPPPPQKIPYRPSTYLVQKLALQNVKTTGKSSLPATSSSHQHFFLKNKKEKYLFARAFSKP